MWNQKVVTMCDVFIQDTMSVNASNVKIYRISPTYDFTAKCNLFANIYCRATLKLLFMFVFQVERCDIKWYIFMVANGSRAGVLATLLVTAWRWEILHQLEKNFLQSFETFDNLKLLSRFEDFSLKMFGIRLACKFCSYT